MVFENLTIFEVHLEDAQFGPETMGESEEPEPGEPKAQAIDEPAEGEDEGGVPIGRLIVASVIVSIVATVVARRLLGGDEEPEVEIDAPEESEREEDVGVPIDA